MPSEGRVLVIGAGIMGLLTALNLAQAGCMVTLIERGFAGRESSWAGGGIVSPLYPWRYSDAVGKLAHWSQYRYAELGSRLLEQTGIDAEVRCVGLYWLDLADEAEALSWATHRCSLHRADISEVALRVPALGGSFRRALHMPGVANVRNPRLLKALRARLNEFPGVTVQEQCSVARILAGGGIVRRLATSRGDILASRIVVAAGAWSGEVLSKLGLRLPVEPVKGQMILYKSADNLLPVMLLAEGRYAIPRQDGHILVGSTLEHVGFDKTPTEQALASLKASAEELLPSLTDAEVVGHWAGLRPGSPDGVPFIGEVPQYPGLWVNCGHYRNGLVLAPASCELLKNLMLGEAPIVDPAPYSPVGRLG